MDNKQIRGYLPVLAHIKDIIRSTRHNAFTAVNTEMLNAYFEIGRNIVEEEQKGQKRAKYGESLLMTLSKELTAEFGRGFDASNLRRMRQFYTVYEKCGTLSHKLTWSHYFELLPLSQLSFFAFDVCVVQLL